MAAAKKKPRWTLPIAILPKQNNNQWSSCGRVCRTCLLEPYLQAEDKENKRRVHSAEQNEHKAGQSWISNEVPAEILLIILLRSIEGSASLSKQQQISRQKMNPSCCDIGSNRGKITRALP